MPESPSGFTYRAFISYGHRDKEWSDWLHRSLETYRVPARLVGKQTENGTIPHRLNPVFRDREELASATDLGRKVNEALGQSENLLVICSPAAAASHWVNDEVLAYKRMGRGERIFCLIVGGEPNATDLPGREAEECFCPALRFATDADGRPSAERSEPIAADARTGKDGKTNAKLKLIAGMLGVGFDALKQRELQRRTRRMTAIAALAVAVMAVTTAMAIMALRAERVAENQRDQADSLIGFMLGDLRTKLEAVDRLDILDDVAGHAMAYFNAQPSDGNIQSRTEHAAALLLLGRVRLDQGKVAEARRAFAKSLELSAKLAVKGNHTPALELAVVDAQFWLGKTAWQTGHIAQSLSHFRAAQPIVTAVIAAHPDNDVAIKRLVWLHESIGHIFQAQDAESQAMREYIAELKVGQQLVAIQPHNRAYQQMLALAYDDIAALSYANGNLNNAEKNYLAERDALEKLAISDPLDNENRARLAISQSFLAQVAEALGHTDSALNNLQKAMVFGETTLAASPNDTDKLGNLASYCRNLAHDLRLSGNAAAAAPLLDRASKLYVRMVTLAPSGIRGRFGLAATHVEQAQLAWQTSHPADARNYAHHALQALAALGHVQGYEQDIGLNVSKAFLLLGKIDAEAGDEKGAKAQWSQALGAMDASSDHSLDPDQLSVQAEVNALLGHKNDTKHLIAKLDEMHYRNPAFIAWRDTSAFAAHSLPISRR